MGRSSVKSNGRSARRLGRDDWLSAALNTLNERGIQHVKALPLSRSLGVTRGSFYWHFKSRADLLRQVLAHWERSQTDDVIRRVEAVQGTARQRLHCMCRDVLFRKYNRYEVAVRAWAMADPAARAVVRRVDRKRARFIAGLFAAGGCSPAEAESAAKVLLSFLMVEPELDRGESRKARENRVEGLIARLL